MQADRPGFHLPLLLAGAFRSVIEELHAELARAGHPGARPLHGFALQAIGSAGATTSELARRLGVSKQAAAKTARSLEELGYVKREPCADDARASILRRTPRGEDLLARSERSLDRIRRRWLRVLGGASVRQLEESLHTMVGDSERLTLTDFPGWLR